MPKISSFSYKVIYVYTVPYEDHKGMMKIGQTEIESSGPEELKPNCEPLIKAAKKRINEQAGTLGASYDLRHVELAHFEEDGVMYNVTDTEVHDVLLNSGYKRGRFDNPDVNPREWFVVSDLEIVKKAIAAAKDGKASLDLAYHQKAAEPAKVEIKFRDEQTQAITQTVDRFAVGNRMLWNAKMRFGKTLCALEVIKRNNYRRTLIITHRPSVRSGWFDDFNLLGFGENYFFGMGDRFRKALKSDDAANVKKFDVLEEKAANGELNYIYFASIQDLRGSKRICRVNWQVQNYPILR